MRKPFLPLLISVICVCKFTALVTKTTRLQTGARNKTDSTRLNSDNDMAVREQEGSRVIRIRSGGERDDVSLSSVNQNDINQSWASVCGRGQLVLV